MIALADKAPAKTQAPAPLDPRLAEWPANLAAVAQRVLVERAQQQEAERLRRREWGLLLFRQVGQDFGREARKWIEFKWDEIGDPGADRDISHYLFLSLPGTRAVAFRYVAVQDTDGSVTGWKQAAFEGGETWRVGAYGFEEDDLGEALLTALELGPEDDIPF